MRSEADPDHHSHDGHPVTHQHREHAISDNDDAIFDDDKPVKFDQQHLDHVRSIRVIEHGQPVTVSDLLDAYNTNQDDRLLDLARRAPKGTLDSFNRVYAAVVAHRRLSPEERAEFDRRTT